MVGKFLLGIMIIVLGFFIGWYMLGDQKIPKILTEFKTPSDATPSPSDDSSNEYTFTEETPKTYDTTTGEEKGGQIASQKNTLEHKVNYNDLGFDPPALTVKLNSEVKFVNLSTGGMWLKSSDTSLIGFDQTKSVTKGEDYIYKFSKIGTWKYYNKQSPDKTGIVVVAQ